MKQGITQEQLDEKKDNTDMTDDAKNQYFEAYEEIVDDGEEPDPDEIRKKRKKRKGKKTGQEDVAYVEWVTHSMPDLHKVERDRYETFCGGFLYFHDVWHKNYGNNFGHVIYFEWFNAADKIILEGNSQDTARKVTIYITPTPKKFNPTPPNPPAHPPPY